MKIRAIQRYIRISPRKLRLVANFLNGLKFEEAVEQLKYMNTKAARWAEKVLFSAAANAEHNFNLKREDLYIKSALAQDGPRLKRWRPVSRGIAHPILRRMSHLKIILAPLVSPEEKREEAKLVPSTKKKRVVQVEPKRVKDFVQSARERSAKKKKEQSKIEKRPLRKIEIFDERRKGKHRSKQHLDKVRLKEKGGKSKQIFRRKAV